MTINQHISCSRLAKLLDVTPRTIRNWAVDTVDPLPGIRVRGIWLFDVERTLKWLERQNSTVATDAMVSELLSKF